MAYSQNAQLDQLQALHDEEVNGLRCRLSGHSREQSAGLAQKHKSKSELARMKREMQQRLINQAVAERQRFAHLLEKRRTELHQRHATIKQQLQQARSDALSERKAEIERKLHALLDRQTLGPRIFVEHLLRTSGDRLAARLARASAESMDAEILPLQTAGQPPITSQSPPPQVTSTSLSGSSAASLLPERPASAEPSVSKTSPTK